MSLSVRAIARTGFGVHDGSAAKPASLLETLARTLDAHGVRYCQWKGHWSAHRWAVGLGDIDLLVDHDARAHFSTLVGELGFKPAAPSAELRIPGIESYFGHDPAVPQLLHLHVHYRLVVGEYWRTTYRLPIERAMLDAALPGNIFRVPAPTHQFLLYVLRMVLHQRGRSPFATGLRWRRGIQIQLDDLEGLSDRSELASILARHLPAIDLTFFDRCVESLRGRRGLLERLTIPYLLHYRLRAYARRPPADALLTAAREKLLPSLLQASVAAGRMRLAGGGTVVALVGGDGAGKSTCARELEEWLANDLATLRAHLGNPPRSLLTLVVGSVAKAEQALHRLWGRSPGPVSHLRLLRYLCTARDCYRLYLKARRFVARGGIAICERYPVVQIRSHVGPCIPALLSDQPDQFARRLRDLEVSYYERIMPPDALFVLRLDPELAVLRKQDEPASYVRTRGRAVWDADWSGTDARIVDVNRPLSEVLQELKALVWGSL